jgi:hypothetical protein
MTNEARKHALVRVRKIAHAARTLVAFDGFTSPPDWRPFVAELADEVAQILEPRKRRKRRKIRPR